MKKLTTILTVALACAFVAPQAMAKGKAGTHRPAPIVKAEKKAIKTSRKKARVHAIARNSTIKN